MLYLKTACRWTMTARISTYINKTFFNLFKHALQVNCFMHSSSLNLLFFIYPRVVLLRNKYWNVFIICPIFIRIDNVCSLIRLHNNNVNCFNACELESNRSSNVCLCVMVCLYHHHLAWSSVHMLNFFAYCNKSPMTCFSCEIAEPLKLAVNSSLLPKQCVAYHNLCQPVDKMPRGVLVHFFVRFFPVVK